MPRAAAGLAPYTAENLLDRLTSRATLQAHYRHQERREAELVSRLLPRGETVLSVGSGWRPGRHLFPAPRWRLVAADANADMVRHALASGAADDALVGHAGELDLPPESFDGVLYRLVLHHISFQGPLRPCFAEAARLLRPGGALVAIEPGLWHPVGLALEVANRLGAGTAVHGTPDDVPLSPRLLVSEARAVGLEPGLHAVTFGWRRLPEPAQRVVRRLDVIGSRPRAARFGHTLLLVARKPAPRL